MTERKSRRTWEEREAILKEWQASGEPVSSFAKRCGVAESTLHVWAHQLKKRAIPTPKTQFLELAVTSDPKEHGRLPASEMTLELRSGIRLRFSTAQDPSDVARFAHALDVKPC